MSDRKIRRIWDLYPVWLFFPDFVIEDHGQGIEEARVIIYPEATIRAILRQLGVFIFIKCLLLAIFTKDTSTKQ